MSWRKRPAAYEPPSEAEMLATYERLNARVAEANVKSASRRALMLTVRVEGDGPECPHVCVTIPENYFSPGRRSIGLDAFFCAVEQHIAALAARNAELEAQIEGTAPSLKVTDIERDERGRMTRLIDTTF
jgi:hypothetical protein